jgi:hypothetical protein
MLLSIDSRAGGGAVHSIRNGLMHRRNRSFDHALQKPAIAFLELPGKLSFTSSRLV